MKKNINIEDLILNYDPEFPQQRFLDAGVAAAFKSSSGRLPSPPPWPAASAPVAVPLTPAPAETDDLSRFRGYDAVIVTWTSAEAAALGAVLTPDYLPSRWYEYRHNVAAYVPLVTGSMAPFKDNTPDMARYYHSLGLYFPCTIGKAKVLLFKSGLHLDYDGPAAPVQKLMAELVTAIAPKVFITTGTGGGIGSNVALGDVVMAGRVRFDCVTQFKSKPWATGSYTTSAVPAGVLAAITPDLTKVNAARIVGARPEPKIWSSADDTIVTTDFFGFDDSTDYYKLQGNGARACDMGDAMVANVLQGFPQTAFYAIRNASDPQIPNPTGKIKAAKLEAGQIYTEYGAFTTAASVIASWAVVDATFNGTTTSSGSNNMSKKSKLEKTKSEKKLKKALADPMTKLKSRVASAHGGYGWSRDLPDARDVLYAAPLLAMAKGLPAKVDLRPKCPPVYNQGQLGCCTGNGIAAAIEFDQMKLGKKSFAPSRLFIYYNERVMENTVATDAGAQIRDGIKSVATIGAPPESVWPYDIKKFAEKPPALAYTDAKLDLVASYAKVAQVLQQMQGCLASGYPFVLGFTVYESFESAAVAKSGIVPMPAPKEQVVGGHCVVAVGYDDATRTFIMRNSWGTGWGMKGYFTMPYEYLLSAHLASDFWTIRSVTE